MKTKLLATTKMIVASLTVVAALGAATVPAYAAPDPGNPSNPNNPGSGSGDCRGGINNCEDAYTKCQERDKCPNIIKKYANPFIAFLSIVVGIAVTTGIIIGGIQYSASAGDPQRAAKAKSHIWAAVIALIAYLFLYAALRFMLPRDVIS